VGPVPGVFLGEAHTREWWQEEQFVPQVSDQLAHVEWLEQRKKSALDYAKGK
jgi:trimethylamine:corrinoid methyltransferase-like protein